MSSAGFAQRQDGAACGMSCGAFYLADSSYSVVPFRGVLLPCSRIHTLLKCWYECR